MRAAPLDEDAAAPPELAPPASRVRVVPEPPGSAGLLEQLAHLVAAEDLGELALRSWPRDLRQHDRRVEDPPVQELDRADGLVANVLDFLLRSQCHDGRPAHGLCRGRLPLKSSGNIRFGWGADD